MMARRIASAAALSLAVLTLVGWLAAGGTRAHTADDSGWLVKFEDLVVAPVARHETGQLLDAGVIETDGFSHVVLCIGGEMKSRPTRAGKIGVVLVPDMYPFDRVLETQGRFVFPLEVTADVAAGVDQVLFESEQLRAPIAFPRYRIYAYNGTDAAAGVWIYAYRTRGG